MADPVVAPVPGSPEYDAAMAAKFDSTVQTPPVSTPEPAARPEHVPEKFWDATKGVVNYEAWAKSTAEAEKKLTELSQGKPPVAPEGEKPPITAEADEAAKTLASKGLQMDAFTAEFTEKGELSETSYKALEDAGIPKAMVDSFIAGQQALASQRDAVGMEAAGGEEAFKQMAEWAAASLPASERALFNKTVAEGSVDQIRFAVAGLKARYEATNGREPKLTGGGQGGEQAGFRSQAEMVSAMSDPRYKVDAAYRADVAKKLGSAQFWNT